MNPTAASPAVKRLLPFLLPAMAMLVSGCGRNSTDDFGPLNFILAVLMLALPVAVVGSILRLIWGALTSQSEASRQLGELVELQRAQRDKLEDIARSLKPSVATLPKTDGPKLRISFGGQELGEIPLVTVRRLIQSGKLTLQDLYFDAATNDWQPLRQCPLLA